MWVNLIMCVFETYRFQFSLHVSYRILGNMSCFIVERTKDKSCIILGITSSQSSFSFICFRKIMCNCIQYHSGTLCTLRRNSSPHCLSSSQNTKPVNFFLCSGSVSCPIKMEPLELLCQQPSEPIASERLAGCHLYKPRKCGLCYHQYIGPWFMGSSLIRRLRSLQSAIVFRSLLSYSCGVTHLLLLLQLLLMLLLLLLVLLLAGTHLCMFVSCKDTTRTTWPIQMHYAVFDVELQQEAHI